MTATILKPENQLPTVTYYAKYVPPNAPPPPPRVIPPTTFPRHLRRRFDKWRFQVNEKLRGYPSNLPHDMENGVSGQAI